MREYKEKAKKARRCLGIAALNNLDQSTFFGILFGAQAQAPPFQRVHAPHSIVLAAKLPIYVFSPFVHIPRCGRVNDDDLRDHLAALSSGTRRNDSYS